MFHIPTQAVPPLGSLQAAPRHPRPASLLQHHRLLVLCRTRQVHHRLQARWLQVAQPLRPNCHLTRRPVALQLPNQLAIPAARRHRCRRAAKWPAMPPLQPHPAVQQPAQTATAANIMSPRDRINTKVKWLVGRQRPRSMLVWSCAILWPPALLSGPRVIARCSAMLPARLSYPESPLSWRRGQRM